MFNIPRFIRILMLRANFIECLEDVGSSIVLREDGWLAYQTSIMAMIVPRGLQQPVKPRLPVAYREIG